MDQRVAGEQQHEQQPLEHARQRVRQAEARLAELAADAIEEAVALVAASSIRWTAQDGALATLAPKLAPADARLDWAEPADALERRVRALSPRPGAFTVFAGERIRILRAQSLAGDAPDPPGTVRLAKPAASSSLPAGSPGVPAAGASALLRIATGAGWLAPRVLQRPGGNALDVEAFQRGHGLPDGARLGGSEADG